MKSISDYAMKETFSNRVRRIAGIIFRQELATLAISVAALCGVFGVLSKGASLTTRNILYVVVASSARGIVAVGQAMVLLTGAIDLSVGGVATLTMCLTALSIRGTTAFPVAGLAYMAFLGACVGALNGLAVSRIGMPSIIVTFASWTISSGVALYLTKGHAITGLPQGMAIFGQGRIAAIPVPVLIFTAVGVVAYFVLNYTSFGRSIYAVGGNPVSAWLSGINIRMIRLLVFVISGLCAALGGLIILSRTMCATQVAAYGLELDSIAAVVIGGISLMGGRGNLIGVILGALILGIITNGMSILAISGALQIITKGIIIFTAVAIDYIRRR